MSALAQQQHMQPPFVNAQASRTTTLFVGSISGGITDAHLNEMLGVCIAFANPISTDTTC